VSGGKIALLVFSCLPVLYVFWQKTKCAILAVAFYSIFFRLCYAVSFFLMQGNGLCMKRWAFQGTSFSVYRKFYLLL